eukprot:gene19022-38197_t
METQATEYYTPVQTKRTRKRLRNVRQRPPPSAARPEGA